MTAGGAESLEAQIARESLFNDGVSVVLFFALVLQAGQTRQRRRRVYGRSRAQTLLRWRGGEAWPLESASAISASVRCP